MPAQATRLAPGRPRHHRVRGFTLVEQLAALTIVATASLTALPALVEFQAEARSVALHSLAAAATSAGVLNQAGCLVTGQQVVPGKCQPVRRCTDVAGLLMVDLPAGYRILPGALDGGGGNGGIGAEGVCTLQRHSDGATVAFRGVSAGL